MKYSKYDIFQFNSHFFRPLDDMRLHKGGIRIKTFKTIRVNKGEPTSDALINLEADAPFDNYVKDNIFKLVKKHNLDNIGILRII